MKKMRIFVLSILFLMTSVFFVACKKGDVISAEKIELSETDLVLKLGETAEVDVVISPEKTTNKKFQIVDGYDVNVVGVNYDYDNMKIYITARDFITANLTETTIGVRTTDGSDKEEHIHVLITEENQSVETPKNLLFDGQNLSWQFVDRAVGYEISINGEIYVLSDSENYYKLDLDNYAGQKVVAKVKANGISKNLDSAWTSELEFTVLARPQNISYNDSTKLLSWQSVENAVSYNVYVNDRPIFTRDTSVSLENCFTQEGQYDIKVMAVGTQNREYVNSAFSNSIIVTKLSTIKEFNIQNGVVFWSTVDGATAYNIEYEYSMGGIKTTQSETVVSTRYALPVDVDAGTYSLKIKAIGNGRTTITGEYGIERHWTKLAKIQNLRVEDGDIIWDANELATSYTVFFENMVDSQGEETMEVVSQIASGDVVRYNISRYAAGEYKLNVIANGTSDKISSDKCDESINVIKLETPKNLQVSKASGSSEIMWDNNTLASSFLLTLKTSASSTLNIDIPQTAKVTYNFNNDIISVGRNIITIQAIGGGYKNGVWYINSEVSDELELMKISAPILRPYNIGNGILNWALTNNGPYYDSYTMKIFTLSGDLYCEKTVTNNYYDLNTSSSFELLEGDYKVFVKANAKFNSNYFDSEYSEEIVLHKLSAPSIKMVNGTIEDLQDNVEENYYSRYVLSNEDEPISSINDYLQNTIRSGDKFSVKAQSVPMSASFNNAYYLPSEYSNVLYIQKLPTIEDASMENGVLKYGAAYANISGYKFEIELLPSATIIDNGTNVVYDFSNVEAGSYSVSIRAISLSNGTDCDENNPLNINSGKMLRPFEFIKLAPPTKIEVSSFASDSNSSISSLIEKLSNYKSNASGLLTWDRVGRASGYELSIDNGALIMNITDTKTSLQNSQITAGNHNITIRSLGNGRDIISSEYMNQNNSIYRMNFTKVSAPSKIEMVNGKISWSYANSSDDPNKNIEHMSVFDALGTSHPLLNPNSLIVTYVLVDSHGNMCSGLDLSNIDFSSITDVSSALSVVNQFIDALKANSCELPEEFKNTTEVSVFAVPFNCYISSLTEQTVSVSNSKFVIGDYSSKLKFTMLETPQGLKIENKKLSWSGLRYNKIQGKTPIKEYQIKITSYADDYIFSVREDSTKTYQIDNANRVIYINDLSNSDLCYWNFDKTHFDNFFGEGTYIPGVYSVSIKAIANEETYIDDAERVYYYINSHYSTSINTEILITPVPRVEDGIIVWDAIVNASGYRVFINTTANKPESTSNYVDVDLHITSYALGSNYPAGTYYVNVITLGNGSSKFSSEFDSENEKTFIKLEKIQNIYIQNGVIKYSQNSVIGTNETNTDEKTYHYSMLVRKSTESEDKDSCIDNGRYLIYELGEEFEGGKQYYIRVVATGDSEKYLTSEPSEYCYVNGNQLPEKLANPGNVSIEDGKVAWQSVPYSTKYNVTIAGETLFTQDTYYDISYIEAGTYFVYVKAIGDNIYLNSTATQKANVKKLSDITGLCIENGLLVWDYVSDSNYVVSVSGTMVQINSENAQIAAGKVKFGFDEFAVGNYQVYLFNNGGANAISSSKTDTIKFAKLSTPSNLSITDENLTFDSVENATKYFIVAKANFAGSITRTYIIEKLNNADITLTQLSFDSIKGAVDSKITASGISATVNSYEISVVAVGSTQSTLNTVDTYYITSNNSSPLIITLPNSPLIAKVFTTNGTFSGKVQWDAVENADYYKVYIKYSQVDLNSDQTNIQLFEATTIDTDILHDSVYKTFKTTNTYINLVYAGTYDIVVAASQNKDGYQSNDSNVLSNVEYTMFDVTENGQDVPYTIYNMEQFNAIKYNMVANYVLGVSEFDIENLETICDKNNMFKGTFDGNNATINLNIPGTNNTFIGLFGYVANGAVIENFTLNANIHSIAQTNDAIYVAAVAGFNYGEIQNIVVNGEISTEYNNNTVYIYNAGVVAVNYETGIITKVLSRASVLPKNNANTVYAGGIATINYGQIELSGFRGIASAQIVGGIVSQVLGGTIYQCYYETDNSIQTAISSGNDGSSYNCAGGIAGYMNGGAISYCYANGKVSGASNNSNAVYVGGLAGYVEKNSMIESAFVVGYDSNGKLISATGLYAYEGVFVGDNVTDCSANWLLCIKTNVQRYIGNTRSSLACADSTTDIKASIENDNLDPDGLFGIDNVHTYPYLKNAKYE